MKPLLPVVRLARSRGGLAAAALAVAAVAVASWVAWRARRATREDPPTGQFVDVDGVRLHYKEQGSGPPIVLLHGNIVSLRDFEACGLLHQLSARHRVIAFDRPGYGHSERPRDRLWTPWAQAEVLHRALVRLGVERATVVGHSMGTMTALALALEHPSQVHALVLLGGYFYPKLRVDAVATAPVALPVIGDVMRYTVSALSARALLNSLVKGMFTPRPVPAHLIAWLSREMMVRPLQLRSNAEDAAFMMPAAASFQKRYGELAMPLGLIAGALDRVIDPAAHSARLHDEIGHSELVLVPGSGHMVHHSTPQQVIEMVERLAGAPRLVAVTPSRDPPGPMTAVGA